MKTHQYLNPNADYDTAAQRFADTGRSVLRDVLTADFAHEIAQELAEVQDWNLVFRDNGRHYDLHRTQWEALVGETYRLLRERVIAVGRLEFQYWYYNLPLYDMVATGRPLSPALERLYQLLQSEDFIERMRELTAAPAIDFADCQATRYTDGSFLTTHDDEVAGKHRHAAYVLGLSHDWYPDWGGLLSFPEHRGMPAAYLLPDFNNLYLFRVPQPHFVSMVSPLAERPRYSITGWLRSRGHNEAGE